ncbi:hypothetical protein [Paenibacillus sp. FSL H8-0034]|uniref:hypothetical protein n=1 Tax=Paenibacillus sp. FSL H8-0034 TaxID=2954671 RepID=UPI0030F8C591
MEQINQGLPEDLTILLRRLVVNGSIRIEGITLYVYFRRCWSLEDELAAYYMRRYFEKYYTHDLSKYRI